MYSTRNQSFTLHSSLIGQKAHSLSTKMEDTSETIIETREELIISPSGEGKPIMRTAHFLKPSAPSLKDPTFDIPPRSFSSLPPKFDPRSWPLSVSFLAWRCPGKQWKVWVDKMTSLHSSTWKKAGIYEAILNSTCEILRNDDLIFGVSERWCSETKSFIFPWGEATITLEDMLVAGFPVLGSPVFSTLETSELRQIEDKLENARVEMIRSSAKKASIQSWLKKFMDSGSEIEHEAFLALWLTRYIFPCTFDSIRKDVFSIAVHLARGTKIALAPAVLACIYRDLSLLKEQIVESTSLANKRSNDGVLSVKLRSPMQLVQVWVWERFIGLRPKPNFIRNGETRFARWQKLKHSAGNVRMVLASVKDSFDWRPYTKPVRNLDFPKFYREEEMWVPVEESIAFARCVRVSALVGLDCMEQYLPHRVAMQFGIDQDIPGCAGKAYKCLEDGWTHYNRAVGEAKLYVPSRLFEADVTTRYKEWWKASMEDLQLAKKCAAVQKQKGFSGSRIAASSFKGRKGSDFACSNIILKKENNGSNKLVRSKIVARSFTGVKVSSSSSNVRMSPKISNATTDGDGFMSSFKITAKSWKEAKEADGFSTRPESSLNSSGWSPKIAKRKNSCSRAPLALDDHLFKRAKILRKSPEGKKEGDNVSASHGLDWKSSKKSTTKLKEKREGKDPMPPHGSPLISRKSAPSSEGKNKGVYEECLSGKLGPILRRKNEKNQSASPERPLKIRKTLPLDFIIAKEINNSPVPPGFPPKSNRVVANDSIEDVLKSGGISEGIDNRLDRNVKNSSDQSRSHFSASVDDAAAKTLEVSTASLKNALKNKDSEIQQDRDGEKSSGSLQNHSSSTANNESLKKSVTTEGKGKQDEAVEKRLGCSSKNLSDQSWSHASSIADKATSSKNLEPMTASVEKPRYSEAVMGGSEGDVEYTNQSSADSPAHRTPCINDIADDSSYKVERPWIELAAHIWKLEKMLAEIKAARRYLST